MTQSILKECVRLILSELKFDRAGYEAAKASLMGLPAPSFKDFQTQTKTSSEIESSEEEKPASGQRRKIATLDVVKEIFSEWEKSAGVRFDDKFIRDASPYLNYHAKQHPDGVNPADMRKIIDQLNGRFQDQLDKLKSSQTSKQDKRDLKKDKSSENALAQTTQKVLDELEKFYNDKKTLPKTRKFDDKSFARDLQDYLKRELTNKDMEKLAARDVEYLVKQANYQFNRYIQSKIKASSK